MRVSSSCPVCVMDDFLLELSSRPAARKLIKSLGLPIPVPQVLDRLESPHAVAELEGRSIMFRGAVQSESTAAALSCLVQAGAQVYSTAPLPERAYEEINGPRPALVSAGKETAKARYDGLVFDATPITTVDGLRDLHEFFHSLGRSIRRCGRCVVISSVPAEIGDPEEAAVQRGLEGFVRSLAKELGKSGATATLLRVSKGSESGLCSPLRFAVSSRSAYVTGQPLTISGAASPGPWSGALSGKTALVTGAARGIGAATAGILAREGASVIVLDRPQDLEVAETTAQALGGTAIGVDMGQKAAAERLVEALNGRVLDVVVHNAGVTRDKMLRNMKRELWEMTLDVNLRAVVNTTEHMLANGAIADGARIVGLSSIAGVAGNAGQTNYSTAKAGVIGYVQNLAPRVRDRGITANAIAPGFIETRMTAAMPMAIREVARRFNTLGQGGRPMDVGEAVLFFAHPASAGVTGQALRVCGGSLVGA